MLKYGFILAKTFYELLNSASRIRMMSGGAVSLPDQRDSAKSRFYSESSDPGLMMRSPSMRKPTTGGIKEEDDDFNENVRVKLFFACLFYFLFIYKFSFHLEQW